MVNQKIVAWERYAQSIQTKLNEFAREAENLATEERSQVAADVVELNNLLNTCHENAEKTAEQLIPLLSITRKNVMQFMIENFLELDDSSFDPLLEDIRKAFKLKDKQQLIQELTDKKIKDVIPSSLDDSFEHADKDYINALGKAYDVVIRFVLEIDISLIGSAAHFTAQLLDKIPNQHIKAYIRILDVLGKMKIISLLEPNSINESKRKLQHELRLQNEAPKKTVICPPPAAIVDLVAYNFEDAKEGLLDALLSLAHNAKAAEQSGLLMQPVEWKNKLLLARTAIAEKLNQIGNIKSKDSKTARTDQFWQTITKPGLLPATMIRYCVIMFAQNTSDKDEFVDTRTLRLSLANSEIKLAEKLSEVMYEFFSKNEQEYPMCSTVSTFRQVCADWQFDPLNFKKIDAVLNHEDLPAKPKQELVNFIIRVLDIFNEEMTGIKKVDDFVKDFAKELKEKLTATIPTHSSTTFGQRLKTFAGRGSRPIVAKSDTALRRSTFSFASKRSQKAPLAIQLLQTEITSTLELIVKSQVFEARSIAKLDKLFAQIIPALLQKQEYIQNLIKGFGSEHPVQMNDELGVQFDTLLQIVQGEEGISKLQEHLRRLQTSRAELQRTDPLMRDWNKLLYSLTASPQAQAIDRLECSFKLKPRIATSDKSYYPN